MRELGQWIAEGILSGIKNGSITLGRFIIEESFVIAVFGSLLCLLLIMCGSNKAKTWLYWMICGFGIIQIGKMVIGI